MRLGCFCKQQKIILLTVSAFCKGGKELERTVLKRSSLCLFVLFEERSIGRKTRNVNTLNTMISPKVYQSGTELGGVQTAVSHKFAKISCALLKSTILFSLGACAQILNQLLKRATSSITLLDIDASLSATDSSIVLRFIGGNIDCYVQDALRTSTFCICFALGVGFIS